MGACHDTAWMGNTGEERKTTPKISELIVKAFGVKRIIYQFRVLFT